MKFKDKEEVEEFVTSSLINLKDIRPAFRRRGNFVFSSTKDGLSDHISPFYIGNQFWSDIEKFVKTGYSVELSGFILETELATSEVKAQFKSQRGKTKEDSESKLRLRKLHNDSTNSFDFKGMVSYNRSRTSKKNIFDSEEVNVEFKVKELPNNGSVTSLLFLFEADYKNDLKHLKNAANWILNKNNGSSPVIESITFDQVKNTSKKHEHLSEVLTSIGDYDLVGTLEVNSTNSEDLGENITRVEDVLKEGFMGVNGALRMLSPEELFDFLEDNSKSCNELKLLYHDEDKSRGMVLDCDDKGDRFLKLTNMRNINAIETITTYEELKEEDRILPNLKKEERQSIIEEFYIEIAEDFYKRIIRT
jgi:hypothetical protein